MSEERDSLVRLAALVSDRKPIDWDLAIASAPEPDERADVLRLRAVAEIVDAHALLRADEPPPGTPPGERPPASVPGTPFGRYRMIERLGQGGMAVVWRAEDTLLGRSVALKFLRPELEDSETARRRFLREARSASRLDHPGIGTVYDFGEQDGRPYLAMQLIEGGTVAARLAERGPLALREAVTLARDAAQALDHAHRRGVTHRDISARNLMLSRDGRVVVVDFGLAALDDGVSLTQTDAVVGTAAYMSPEVIQGEKADPRSDQFSLGVVVYEMLTGSRPFDADRIGTVLWRVVNEPMELPSSRRADIPAVLDRLLSGMLAKAPTDRYPSLGAVADELDDLLRTGSLPESRDETATLVPGSRPTSAPMRASSTRASRPAPSSKSRFLWIAVAGLGVLMVSAAIQAWMQRGTEPTAASSDVRFRSVAVLPLRNDSTAKSETEHLGEGLAQSLISKLTQVGGVEVTPWMTSRRFRDPADDPSRVAAELGVEALLVGHFRADAERLRGTITLIDGGTGRQVWADDFDEAAGDLFRVQNRIALAAATRLSGALTGTQVDRLTTPIGSNAEAYELYL
ncbi:MAG TPA: serine/threonine-protein kinase, partial [Candidatus Polarisedimenticolaceae bacterium]